jgi:hypothetical protein
MGVADTGETRIGVVVVHGIGEQQRFEHLEGQVRALVAALGARPGASLTVEIASTAPAPLHATQDTWLASRPVRVHVHDPAAGRCVLEFHEVWWADVNEPYSLMKQLRFWCWSLALWVYPGKFASTRPSAHRRQTPTPPEGNATLRALWIRARLYGVAFVAVLLASSVGIVFFLAERLLKIRTPRFLQTFVNYIAGVKLYNQQVRMGGGLPATAQDFLDTIGEPPRVSVRRRMIRVLMQVAERSYDRWYVLAHSLGSVVAFNGLMEIAYKWPGYFERTTWEAARAARPPLAGAARPEWPAPGRDPAPARPVWVADDEVAYRSRIFHHLRGVLTFGSPLEKFAALWPFRVALALEPAFRDGTEWINVYDPLDPVSGVLRSFDRGGAHCCPPPRNVGYASGPVLLLSHLQYLSAHRARRTLADGVAEWLLSGSAAQIPGEGRGWFTPGSGVHRLRSVLAWGWWLFGVALLAAAGAWLYPRLFGMLDRSGGLLRYATPNVFASAFANHVLAILALAALLPLVTGIVARLLVFSRDPDDPREGPQRAAAATAAAIPEILSPEAAPAYEEPWPR